MSFWLGIDAGSVAVKAVLLEADGRLVYEDCRATEGRLAAVAARMVDALPGDALAGVAVTGTGKDLLARLTGAATINEIAAIAAGACVGPFRAEAARGSAGAAGAPPRTVIDIGGQDAKLILLDADGGRSGQAGISDFAMNDVCAAGTGAFLEHLARRLGLSLEEFGRLALQSASPAPVAGRCTVFAKSDVVHLLQQGHALADVLAGLCRALARSFRTALVKHRRLPEPILFVGGAAANPAVLRALREEIGAEIIVPPHHRVRGALGAALHAMENPRDIGKDDLAAALAGNGDGGRVEGDVAPEIGPAREPSPGCRAFSGRLVRHGDAASSEPSEYSNGIPASLGQSDLSPADDEAESRVRGPRCPAGDRRSSLRPCWIGVDVGAASVKLAAVDDDAGILAVHYALSKGEPAAALREGLSAFGSHPGVGPVKGVGITGSGRRLIGAWLGADLIVDEISAQARAAAALGRGPDARRDPAGGTVIDIGGEDAKFIRFGRGGDVERFAMNAICSAGTGAFLEEQAGRLDVPLAELGRLAMAADRPARLDSKCTVFMESDLVHEMQRGVGAAALAAGLARSVVENYLEKTAAGQPFAAPVLFVGGVAANPAVVAAFEDRLGLPIHVPEHHQVSGAFGAALLVRAAAPAETMFRGFDPGPPETTSTSFSCDGCPQRCSVEKVTVRGKAYHRGSSCGRYDRGEGRAAGPDLFRARLALLTAGATDARKAGRAPETDTVPAGGRGDIGIPRIFFFYDMFPLWAAFFRELGHRIRLSPPTSRAILDDGLKSAPVDACLPVKAACGHVRSLFGSAGGAGPPWIFLPGFPERPPRPGSGFPKSLSCAYQASFRSFLPEDGEAAASTPGRGARILCPSVPGEFFDPGAFYRAVGRELGFSDARTAAAYRRGLEAQAAFEARAAELGRSVSASGPRLVLFGRRYVLYDSLMALHVPAKLRSAGHPVLPFDLLPAAGGRFRGGWRDSVFRESQDILRAARAVAAEPDLHPVFVGHFGCGVDAFLIKSLDRLFAGKRWLRLELDEHSGEAGLETRCEAFLRSLGPAGGRPGYAPPDCAPSRRHVDRTAAGPVYFVPDNGDNFLAVRAALRSRGLRAEMLPRGDAESLRLGNARSSGRECLAYRFLLGDAVKWSEGAPDEAARPGESRSGVAKPAVGGRAGAARDGCGGEGRILLLPGLDHCLAHHYAAEIAQALRDEGRPGRVMGGRICPDDDEVIRIVGLKGLRVFWKTWVAVDYLQRLHRERRGAAPGRAAECDAIYGRALARLGDNAAFDRIQPLLEEAAAALAAVPGDGLRRPVIGIVGEPYTIFNPHANGGLMDAIETMGGIVWLPPHVSDYFRYLEIRRARSSRRRRDPALVMHWLRARVQARDEAAVAEAFRGRLRNFPEPGPDESRRRAAGYMTKEDDPLGVFTAAKALDFAAKGADGLLDVLSFQCMVGYKAAAALDRIRRDLGVPVLHLILDGQKDLHVRNRLEAFLHQLRRRIRLDPRPLHD